MEDACSLLQTGAATADNKCRYAGAGSIPVLTIFILLGDIMGDDETDLVRIAKQIEEISLLLSANTHEHIQGDSVTMVKDGFIKAQVKLARLSVYVRGLDSTHRSLDSEDGCLYKPPSKGEVIMHGGGRD